MGSLFCWWELWYHFGAGPAAVGGSFPGHVQGSILIQYVTGVEFHDPSVAAIGLNGSAGATPGSQSTVFSSDFSNNFGGT